MPIESRDHDTVDRRDALLRSACITAPVVMGEDTRNKIHIVGPRRVRVARHRGAPTHGSHEWPTSTPVWCWHCCHPFDTRPLPMPTKFDSHRDVFHVMGTFCSWACMKAYNSSTTSYLKNVVAEIITLFHKRCTGVLRGIRPAPPRVVLKAFGGHMTIDEFRAASERGILYDILPPRMIIHQHAVHERHIADAPRRTARNLQEVVSFENAAAKNEPLRLKRSKPLQKDRNLLERTMGITVETVAPDA